MSEGVRDPTELLARGSREHYEDVEYYDYVYRRRRADVEYYKSLGRKHGGPVLELGVGSGRVAIPMALDGATVFGIDTSAAMLEKCQAKALALKVAPGRLRLCEGDMRRFALGRRFALVIAPFNALLHLYEPDELMDCFRCVREHLGASGRFVFDVRVPSVKELSRSPEREYLGRGFVHPTLGVRVRYTERFEYDPIKQVQYITMRFEPDREGRAPVETLLTQRQIFPAELRALLSASGLRLVGRHGDFSGRPLAPDDPLEVVTAVRSP